MKLGQRQILKFDHFKEFGAYLTDGTDFVLLPKKEVQKDVKAGDEVEVFLYLDSSDRPVATTVSSYLVLHEVGVLTVVQTGKIGAFLDWGLPKDLLLPFHEQTGKVRKGDQVLVAPYIDKTGRLAATMRVYPYLRCDSPYKKDERVNARIYEISVNFGIFAAVDDKYSALIPETEVPEGLHVGDIVLSRITSVRPDGRLYLSVREKAYKQMEIDAQVVLKVIGEYEGVLPFDDRVSPQIIRREFHLSKNAFKRAVGHLIKAGKAKIKDGHIYILHTLIIS